MRGWIQAAFYSALFTIYGGSFYYLYQLAVTLSSGGDLVKMFFDTLLGLFICWLFLTFVFREIGKAFDELNQANRRPPSDSDKDPSNSPKNE